MPDPKTRWSHLSNNTILHELQLESFEYFNQETNFKNGMVRDRSFRKSPASIACIGLALSAYPVAVERKFISRRTAVRRTLNTLRFFANSEQSKGARATGYNGFYYHFLSQLSGRRVWRCELSTIDTAILLAGVLVAASYFRRDTPDEREIREAADSLYLRTDWQWALNNGRTVSHGWKPRHGFIKYRWKGYNEALLLYILALGSPTYPLPQSTYKEWTAGFEWKRIFGRSHVYAGPLFIHQLPQVWLDLRGVQDDCMRKKRSDYFKNSCHATLIQQQYAVKNPGKFAHYGRHCWGITASDGPGNVTVWIDGIRRRFYDYLARGVPFGPDDGTISPWAAVASLPFAPGAVLPTIRNFDNLRLRERAPYGFEASFNPTFPVKGSPNGWTAQYHYGLNQGPVVLMIENYRSGLLWRLMRNCPYIRVGLRRAGFRGGWLNTAPIL